MALGANKVGYGLYRDGSRSQVWGSTIATNTVGGTGTGAAQNLTVYARVPPQVTPPAGTYSDVIVVTITY
jgi:spore coat protein U-like protein